MPDAPKPPPAKPAAPPAPPAPPPPPYAFTHNKQPDWGIGLVLHNLADHWVLYFENAGEKKFLKRVANDMLTPTKMDQKSLDALSSRANGRKRKAPPKPSKNLITGRKPAAKASAGPRFASVKVQIEAFEKLFPGGFTGDAFVKGERGVAENNDDGDKQFGIALAQSTLSKEAFANESADVLFERAQAVLKATNIVFPIEGVIPFRGLAGADREKALAALKDLLHGSEAYGERLTKFAAALTLKDSKGVAKKVTWPLATVFGGLLDPKQNVCVKPTAFALQALTVGMTVDKSAPLAADSYAKFVEVLKKTEAALVEAGHKPRDLMDVYSFIYRTHAEKPAAAVVAVPAA